MPIDKKYIGKKYGPTTYVIGAEKLRELLSDLSRWERIVVYQARAIRRLREERPERRVQEAWSELVVTRKP